MEIGQGSRPCGASLYQKVEIFDILGSHSHPSPPIDVKFCTAKQTQVSVGPAKFDLTRFNESSLRGEKPDFGPVSKSNTGSVLLRGILPVTNTTFSNLQPSRVAHLPQTLHVDRAHRAHHRSCHSFFDLTYSFSNRVHGKIWPNLPQQLRNL